MPFGGALVAGGLVAGGAAMSMAGGKKEADAKQQIAQDQLGQQTLERNYAMGKAAPSSYDLDSLQRQLENYQHTYSLQSAQLQHDMSLQDMLSPQIQSLLKGGSAPTLNPYLNVVQNQKDSLSADLARQLGSGWETSTAGQAALNNFNLQSANQGAQIQQNYLGSLMSSGLGLSSLISGENNQNAQTLAGINQGGFNMSNLLAQRQIAASEGTSLTGFQGADQIGAMGRGAMMGQMGNQFMNAGTTFGTAMMTGKPPTPGASPYQQAPSLQSMGAGSQNPYMYGNYGQTMGQQAMG